VVEAADVVTVVDERPDVVTVVPAVVVTVEGSRAGTRVDAPVRTASAP
jgi:hypothetical protein